MKVLIVIVTYNGMKWIDRCLSALRQSTHPVTTIVIDNHSTDGTPEFISSHFPEVVLEAEQENLGFGQGNNVGLRYALDNGFDYVMLLNQDAYLQPNAIEQLLRVADGHNLFSPLHLNGEGTHLDWFFRESLRMADIDLLDNLLIDRLPQPTYTVGEVCAACWFMPIEMLQTIGGFNPLFFHYGEDSNYYTRLLFHHRETIVVPAAHVWHDRGKFGNQTVHDQLCVRNRVYIALCDPGASLSRRLRKLARVMIEESAWTTLKESVKAFMSYNKIANSRHLEQQQNTTWLQ